MRDYQDIITVAVMNFRPFWGEKERNLRRITGYINAAAKRGADLICFPELSLIGQDTELCDIAFEDRMHTRMSEVIPGPSVNAIAEVTSRLGIYAVFGMSERDPDDPAVIYNAAVICGPDGYIDHYRKIHPANDEALWTTGRGKRPVSFMTKWGPIGVGICYDSFSFQEILRYHAAKGARLYVNISAISSGVSGDFDWESNYFDTLSNGVIANDIFIASANNFAFNVNNEYFCNQVGNKTVPNPIFYGGGSAILGPGFKKKVHVYAGGIDVCQPEFFIATLDLSTASRMIYNPNPWSGKPDFRPDIYKTMLEDLLQDPYWNQYE